MASADKKEKKKNFDINIKSKYIYSKSNGDSIYIQHQDGDWITPGPRPPARLDELFKIYKPTLFFSFILSFWRIYARASIYVTPRPSSLLLNASSCLIYIPFLFYKRRRTPSSSSYKYTELYTLLLLLFFYYILQPFL